MHHSTHLVRNRSVTTHTLSILCEFDCDTLLPPGTQQDADWYADDPDERRKEAGSPVSFAIVDSDVSETLAAIRHSSIAVRMASTRDHSFHARYPDVVPTQPNLRQSEDSTSTVRRPSYNGTEGCASRRSSLSFIAPQSLPLPPSKDGRKSKDKGKRKGEDFDVAVLSRLIGSLSGSLDLLDVAPLEEAVDTPGVRRPSTVTPNDPSAGGLRFHDPYNALSRNEWSFIRDRDRISRPPREQDGNPRHWDVWRCPQIGQIRIERANLPPCTCISVPYFSTC
jgi:hypothetical protein